MGKLFRDIPLFVEAAKHKSFTKAAESLDMPLSTVSRRIQHMERALNLPLFHRGKRSLELTDHGKTLYERCRYIVAETESAVEELLQAMESPRGLLRLAMSGDVYYTMLRGTLTSFARKWPDIRIQIHFSDWWVDLYSEPFDLDIRAGIIPASSFKVRKLLSMPTTLYASPELFLRLPVPEQPPDLENLPCIAMEKHGRAWVMAKGKKKESVIIHPAYTVNNANLAQELAVAGLGVAWMIPSMVQKELEEGKLVSVLPGWTIEGIELSIIMPSRQLPHRVRLFVDHLVEHFATLPH